MIIPVLIHCKPSSVPIIQNGVLEAPKDWRGEPISLRGDWLALPGIRSYEDFLDHYHETMRVPIPSSGNKFRQGVIGDSVTLFLHVDFGEYINSYENLSILTEKIKDAHEVYINGHKIMEVGKVSKDPGEHRAKVKPEVATFPYTRSIDIVVKISSNPLESIGMMIPPILGESSYIYREAYFNKLYDVVFIVVLLFFILTNLGIYISYTKDKGPLIYSVLLGVGLVLIPFAGATSRMIWDFFPDIPYIFVKRTEGGLYFLLGFLYVYFIKTTFPQDFNPKVFKAYVIYKIVLFLVLYPVEYLFFKSLIYVFILEILTIFYSYYVLLLAVKRERYQALLFFVGFLVITMTIIVDLTYEFGIDIANRTSLYGMFFMFFIHSSALVLRVRKAYSDREELTKDLIASKESLELRVEERTLALREALMQAKDANQLKDRFISIVSHDIRSPLSGVNSLIYLILSDPDMEKEEIYNLLKSSNKSLSGLIRMTEEILSYAKTQEVRILPDYEVLEIKPFIDDLLDRMQSSIQEKKIHLLIEGEEKLRVPADPSLLSIAIVNFISNSIKFTDAGGTIALEFHENEKNALMSITDTGRGMSSEQLERVFHHGENKSTLGTQGERGTGFGMPFSKEILDSMQIQASIESEIGKGTSICLEFPRRSKNLLLVDDNLTFRSRLRKMIEGWDPDIFIIEKENVESAFEQFKNYPIDYLITDYNLPGYNGISLIYRILEHSPDSDIAITLVTSISEREEKIYNELREKLAVFGIDNLITKDLESEEFQNQIRSFLDNPSF